MNGIKSMSQRTVLIIGFTMCSILFGDTSAHQEYRACENSFQCTTYCRARGFNDRVCKTVTVDESPNIDETILVNKRLCLCSDAKEEYGGNPSTGEYFHYWFSPGHECVRNGSSNRCKEYCRRIRVDPKYCECQLSSCKFPKKYVRPAQNPVGQLV